MEQRCEAIKKTDGERCTNPAKGTSRYCGIHQKDYQGGRPSKYDQIDVAQIEILAEYGLTDEQMAKVFDVSLASFKRYKNKHDEFRAALKEGKQIADAQVEMSLYKRATGYSHQAVDIRQYKGRVIETEYIEHYPPDPTSMIFWLKNRKPEKWRDKVDHGVSVEDERGAISSLMDMLAAKYQDQKAAEGSDK